MKKVLSVLLAAAMVAGMSVASFADVTFGAGDASKDFTNFGVELQSIAKIILVFNITKEQFGQQLFAI